MNIDLYHEILDLNDELKLGYHLKEFFLDIVKKCTYEDAEKAIKNLG